MAEWNFIVGDSVINRYVRSLHEVSIDMGIENLVLEQINSIKKYITDMENRKTILKRVALIKSYGAELIDTLNSQIKLSKEVKNFLNVLLKNNRLASVIEICECYSAYIDKTSGKKTFFATVAKEIPESEKKKFANDIREVFGGEIELIFKKDPSIIDGIVLQYRSKILDYSLKSRITRLHSAIRRGSYES